MILEGDYVLATQYFDGNPSDAFCVGFYDCDAYAGIRHMVRDGNGDLFSGFGFRRCAKIGVRRGEWIVKHVGYIEKSRFSVWHWYRAPWSELKNVDGKGQN